MAENAVVVILYGRMRLRASDVKRLLLICFRQHRLPFGTKILLLMYRKSRSISGIVQDVELREVRQTEHCLKCRYEQRIPLIILILTDVMLWQYSTANIQRSNRLVHPIQYLLAF